MVEVAGPFLAETAFWFWFAAFVGSAAAGVPHEPAKTVEAVNETIMTNRVKNLGCIKYVSTNERNLGFAEK